MHEARREASYLEQDRPQTTGGEQQTPEPDTAPAPSDPAPQEVQEPPADVGDALENTVAAAAAEPEPEPEPEPTTDRWEMTTPQSPGDTEEAVPVQDPPEARRFRDVLSLAADPAFEMHLSGLEGQGPDSGELRYGDAVFATLHWSSAGAWFARLAVDDLPADVTYLNGSLEATADQAALMFSAFTGAPYGVTPSAAADGPLSRAEVLRVELRGAAERHRDAITAAARRVSAECVQSPQFRELDARLGDLAGAVGEGYGSVRMTADLVGVQQAVTAWGDALPEDPDHDERRLLAFPLAHLLYETGRLQAFVQATVEAATADREARERQDAAAPTAAPAESAGSVRDLGARPTQEAVRGPAAATAPATTGAASAADGEQPAPAAATQDQPEPERWTGIVPFPLDSAFELHLSGVDGQDADHGDVYYMGFPCAKITRADDGQWTAKGTDYSLAYDATTPADSVYVAAEQFAVQHSAVLGHSYGEPPVAAIADGPAARAQLLRAELSEIALRHRESLGVLAERVAEGYSTSDPRAVELLSRLNRMAEASSRAHDSRQMVDGFNGVELAAAHWRETLSPDWDGAERQLLGYPLALLLVDVYRFRDRLEATVEVARAEQVAERERAAAEQAATEAASQAPAPGLEPERVPVAPGRAMREDRVQEASEALSVPVVAPNLEAVAAAVQREAPAPGPDDSPEETEMAAPARSAVPEGEAPAPAAAAPDGEAPVPGAGRLEGAGSGELPLWTGPDAAPWQAEERPVDVVGDFAAVIRAWDETVPAERGTGEDLFADVRPDLSTIQEMLAEHGIADPGGVLARVLFVGGRSDGSSETEQVRGEGSPGLEAGAVNAALGRADAHAPALQDLPEWQKIQTVRGAFGHLVRVIRERAGEYVNRLMGDHRVGNFLRKISIRVCEKVAQLAQAGADRLRRGGKQEADTSAAGALQDLGDAATAYASTGEGHSGPPPASRGAASITVDIPSMRRLGEALARPLPGAKTGRDTRVSAAAARGKSTTRQGSKKPGGTAEQPEHLRRGGTVDQQPTPKPQR
ncbi:hypothetical protein [Streptomyces sp. NPDC001089]